MHPEPLLAIAGIGSDEESWADLTSAMGDHARLRPVIAQGETMEAMARNVLAEAPDRFALAGHSMGGYVALAMLRAEPHRITRLALLNTSAAADTREQALRRAAGISRVEQLGFAAAASALAPLTLHPNADPALVDRVRAMILRTGERRYIRDQRATAARPDRGAMLSAIAVPTLVVGAVQDRVVDPAAARTMASAISDAHLVMRDDCGHMSPMEAPEALAAAMMQWLGVDQAQEGPG